VIEISLHGFQARTIRPLAVGTRCAVRVALGDGVVSQVEAVLVRQVPSASGHFHGFRVEAPDAAWRRCVAALAGSETHADLSRQTAAAVTAVASEARPDLLPA
jgi:hypothetical protein